MNSILTCCPNGTYYAKFGVWTRTIAPQCGQLDKGAEVDQSSGSLLYWMLMMLIIYVCGAIMLAVNARFQAWFFRTVERIALTFRNPFRNFYYRA